MKTLPTFLTVSVLLTAGCSAGGGGESETTPSSSTTCDAGLETETGGDLCPDSAGDGSEDTTGGVASASDSDTPTTDDTLDPTAAEETSDSDDPPSDCVMGGALPDLQFEGTVSGAHTGTYTLDLPMGTFSPTGEGMNGSYLSSIGLFNMQALGSGSEWQFALPSAALTTVEPGTYPMNSGRLDIGGFTLPTAPDGWASTSGDVVIDNVIPHCLGAPTVYIDGSFGFDASNNENGTSISATGTFSGVAISVG